MEKVKITFENMFAGLLLRFGKVNRIDLEIIQNDIYSKYGILMSKFALDYMGISRYIINIGDMYYPINSDEAKAVLEEKQGKDMKTYLETLNVEDMVMLKLSSYGAVPDYMIGTVFSDEQEKVLSKLQDDLQVIYVWNNDIPCDDYQELQLTSFGEARVFELEYKTQVEEFKELLKSEGYDIGLIPDFLRAQNLTMGIYEILNIDNFLYYCSTYDRAAKAAIPEEGLKKKIN